MTTNNELETCKNCLNDSLDQGFRLNEDGICNYCERYQIDKDSFFFVDRGGDKKFKKIVENIKEQNNSNYDCIIGLSGGVDSSYLAYKLKEYDLRVLAIHVDAGWNTETAVGNIQKVIEYTNFDLETLVLEWDEVRRLQLALLKGEVMNQDIAQDHAFFAALYKYAIKSKTKFVFTGSNMQTEGVWGYYGRSAMDKTYLKDVFKKYGAGTLPTYPTLGFFSYYFLIPYIYKINVVKPFNYLGYDKEYATNILRDKIGYKVYKYKHGESIWTRFFQDYILPTKFNYDKRKIHLSAQLFNGDISRADAIKVLNEEPYDQKYYDYDCDYISRKLEISKDEFQSYLKPIEKDPDTFKTNESIYKSLKFAQKLIEKILGFKISNYS